MRKSFILHIDSLSILTKMPDEMAGKFIKLIYQFQLTGELLEMDFALEMAITPFINQFERDNKNYDKTCETNRINGLNGGRPKKQTEPIESEKTHSDNLKPKKPYNDSDSNNDSENRNNNDNDNIIYVSDKSDPKPKSYKQWSLEDFKNEMTKFKLNYPTEILIQFYDYWRELTPSGKMKLQLEKSWQTDLRIEKWFKNSHNFTPKNNNSTQLEQMGDAFQISLQTQLNKNKENGN